MTVTIDMWLAAVGVLALGVAVWMIHGFNRLVRHRNLVREGWSGIDVQLKLRHDLIPNLVEIVKAHGRYEKGVLEEVTRLRAESEGAPDMRARQDSENALTMGLRNLFAVVEAYPEITASKSFLELQKRLVEVEDRLQMARRYYNGAVRDYNIRVEAVPSNVVAKIFSFRLEEFFEVESATERQAPKVGVKE